MKTCTIPSAERFRALGTGVGQSQAMSERTGLARGRRVVATCPQDKKKFLKARGYPTGEGSL